ncbi:hypothetical protein ACKZDW_18745 [Ralstonia syzygii subsp. celebesensis]|nr:hypothetical protein [Ralstonia syzygii]
MAETAIRLLAQDGHTINAGKPARGLSYHRRTRFHAQAAKPFQA